jgi:hypothetical protein
MADDKIDPALAQITGSTEHYLEAFQQKGDPGFVRIQTSTCAPGAPARVPLYTETQWTRAFLYPKIAARYEHAQTYRPGYDYKQRLQYAGEPFGRRATTVKKALSSFSEST